MAELLVKAVDASHANPTKDVRGCYKQGDVVGVAPDGWDWGALERLAPAEGGKFVRIRISDVTRAQVLNWVRNNWATEIDQPDGTRRRRVRIDVDLLPAGVRNTLNATGFYENTWANIRQYIRNKLTTATAVGAAI